MINTLFPPNAKTLLVLSRCQAVEQKALGAMMDYLREYLRLAEVAEPLEGDGPLQDIAAGHAAYSNYRWGWARLLCHPWAAANRKISRF